jgi:hypothetical protein
MASSAPSTSCGRFKRYQGAGPLGNVLFRWDQPSLAQHDQPRGRSQLVTPSNFGLPTEQLDSSGECVLRKPKSVVESGEFVMSYVAALVDPIDGETIFDGGALQLYAPWNAAQATFLNGGSETALAADLRALSLQVRGWEIIERAVRWMSRLHERSCRGREIGELARCLGWVGQRILSSCAPEIGGRLVALSFAKALEAEPVGGWGD